MEKLYKLADRVAKVSVNGSAIAVSLADQTATFSARKSATGIIQLVDAGGLQHSIPTVATRDGVWAFLQGKSLFLQAGESGTASKAGPAAAFDGKIKTPMPGKVVKICVNPGQAVQAGQICAIVEAMKMEHNLSTPQPGVVSSVHAQEGELAEFGKVLVEITVDTPA